MSLVQTGIGIAGAVLALNFAVSAILPEPVRIQVQALAYDNGVITQERTVRTENQAFYAQWAATVENADTGESVRWCEGSGANAYAAGHKVVTFTLPDWTGRKECTPESLPPGRYVLSATWHWGVRDAAMKSEPFEVNQ